MNEFVIVMLICGLLFTAILSVVCLLGFDLNGSECMKELELEQTTA